MITKTQLFPFILLLVIATPLTAKNIDMPEVEQKTILASIHQQVDKRILDVELFNQALSSQPINIKETALIGLGRIGGDPIRPLVVPFLNDKNTTLRCAAVFALGISGSPEASEELWLLLEKETNENVKQETYLALGNLGGDNLVSRMLAHVKLEKEQKTQAAIFQALAIAITYHQQISKQISVDSEQSTVNFDRLLKLMADDSELSYFVGYFLAKVKNIEQHIDPADLEKLTNDTNSLRNKKVLARLIGKVTQKDHPSNRQLLAWLIEQSNNPDVGLVVEAIQAMGSLLKIPQARLQLGKLHGSTNPLIAQSALQVLADSSLDSMQMTQLLKKNLKSNRPSMVAAAMKGLIKRQERDKMSWALKILTHKNSFVKIRFALLIADKDKKEFSNVLKMLSKDIDPKVARVAKNLLSEESTSEHPIKTKTTSYSKALKSNSRHVLLRTSAGDIEFQINQHATYTAAHFINLVNSGYYNDTYFSRMLGNFVAQGGDSVGDMDGGSGQMIREEVSYLSHKIGSVGMATSGKDTGDAQFFINLGDNIHLDRKYTIFAEVVSGLKNVYRLSNGDQIISAEVLKEQELR